MRLRDAIDMLADSGVGALGPTMWADLGCGAGTFTLALAELLAPRSTIHAMDRDGSALRRIPPRHKDVGITTHRGWEIARWVGAVREVVVPRTLREREEIAEAGEAQAFTAEGEVPTLLVERSQAIQAARERRDGRQVFFFSLNGGALGVVVEPLDVGED